MNTLAIIARPTLKMPVVLVHLAPHPASYALSLQTSLQRRLLADPTPATTLDAFQSCPAGIAWIPSEQTHVLALASRNGDCVCISSTAEVLAPTFDVPAVSPVSRLNVTIPDIPQVWNGRSRSVLAVKAMPTYFLVAGARDKSNTCCILVADGIYGAVFLAPEVRPSSTVFEQRGSMGGGRRVSELTQRRLSRRLSCAPSKDPSGSMSVPQLYSHLDHLLQPCHADKTSTGLTRVTTGVMKPLIAEARSKNSAHAIALAMHAILHVERWLEVCFGGTCQWNGGWSLLAEMKNYGSYCGPIFKAFSEIAQIKLATSMPCQEEFGGVGAITLFLQGHDPTKIFKSVCQCPCI